MEDKSLRKIKSKYIFQHIFSFIQDENYIYKAFKYSRFFQKKLNLDYNNIKQNIIIFDKYLLENDEYPFENDLTKFKLHNKNIESYIVNYFKNHPKKNIKEYDICEFSLDISILSPLYDILIKQDFFRNMFNIVIDFNEIKKNKMNKAFENYSKLNKMKLSNLSFKFIIGNKNDYRKDEKNDINNFKKFFTNYDKTKKFGILNYELNLFNNIFDMADNLIYLKCEKLGYAKSIDLLYLLNNITKFKSLTYLEITNYCFVFDEYNHNIDKICNDINLKNSLSKLKSIKLKLHNNYRKNLIDTLKFESPNLEKLSIESELDYFDKIIDFKKLPNLKYFKGSEKNFSSLKIYSLKKVKIYEAENWIKTLEKLSKIQSLEEFNIKYMNNLNKFDDGCIKKNENVKKIKLDLKNDVECILYDFQNKFPNLTDFSISIKFYYVKNTGGIKIVENPNCKVNTINIEMWRNNNLELYCNSYKSLKSFKLHVDNNVNIKESIPLFSNNCNVIFESLISLDLSFQDEKRDDSEDLNNLYNNIDKIPNLKEFNIVTSFTDGNDFYKKFIEKILAIKFIIKINIKKNLHKNTENFSRELLSKIFPNINLNRIYEINIEKYEDNFEKYEDNFGKNVKSFFSFFNF